MDSALNEFVASGSAEAFRRLVAAHADAVYAQCVRRLRDRALAEDVTQAVFLMLAQQARRLPENVVLGGWLFVAARYACLNALRADARRKRHEQKAAQMKMEAAETSQPAEWEAMQGQLDEALAGLGEADRNAVVLRYLENRSMSEVGAGLGISVDAAKQRVSRALAKLRKRLKVRGVDVSAAALPALLEHGARCPAPQGLVDAVARVALGGGGPEISLIAKGAFNMMTWTKIRIAAMCIFGFLTIATTAVAVAQATSSNADAVTTMAPLTGAERLAADVDEVEIPAALEGEWVPIVAEIPVRITIRDRTLIFVADQRRLGAGDLVIAKERIVLDITNINVANTPHGIDGIVNPQSTMRGRPSDHIGRKIELAYVIDDQGQMHFAMGTPGSPRPTVVVEGPGRKALVLRRLPSDPTPATQPAR